MKDAPANKKQLIEELAALRLQNKKLKNENRLLAEFSAEKENLEISLRERVKELNCLYEITELTERHENDLDAILSGIVSLLPISWHYPEITCARIFFKKKEYKTPNFKQSKWKQEAEIMVDGSSAGSVEVYYLKEMPTLYEGPFLKEERLLINAVSERVRLTAERFKMSQQLSSERNVLKKTNIALRERVKELNCLYEITELTERHENDLDAILNGIVSLLPASWQYPEFASARIFFKGREYQTSNFEQSKWKQEAEIMVDGSSAGTVEVYYLKKMPTLYEGPFLKEERLLINAVSERVRRLAERISIRKQLGTEKNALQKANIALHEVLGRIQNEKKMIAASIQSNVDKIILPVLYSLEKEMNPLQRKYLDLLKKNWGDIISPFADKVLENFSRLTPAEIAICNMVKHGLSTKEIAQMRRISPDTVKRHREHIRRKLGLTNQKINLSSYLNHTPSSA